MVKGVLREELEHSLGAVDAYNDAISKLPRGSLVRKSIRNKEYYYLAYRLNSKKVVLSYIGRLSEEQVTAYRENIDRRRRYQQLLRELKQKISYLRKALNVKVR